MLMIPHLLLFPCRDRHRRLWMVLDALTHRVHEHAASHSGGCKIEWVRCDPRRLLVETILQILRRCLLVIVHSILRTACLHIRLHNL
jgi:hypothetical protein